MVVVLATSTRPPTIEELKTLTMSDVAIAAGLADSFRDRLNEYAHVDHYTLPDPFGESDDYNYSVVLDAENPNRVVAMIANTKSSLPQLPWTNIMGERLVKVGISKQEAQEIKRELMPKLTNNFYPYRRNGMIAGCIMFAFQICGLR